MLITYSNIGMLDLLILQVIQWTWVDCNIVYDLWGFGIIFDVIVKKSPTKVPNIKLVFGTQLSFNKKKYISTAW